MDSWGLKVARALALRRPPPTVAHSSFKSTPLHRAQAITHADVLPPRLLSAVLKQATHHTSSREGTTWVDASELVGPSLPRTPIEDGIRALLNIIQVSSHSATKHF
jgi:hypothetical protein